MPRGRLRPPAHEGAPRARDASINKPCMLSSPVGCRFSLAPSLAGPVRHHHLPSFIARSRGLAASLHLSPAAECGSSHDAQRCFLITAQVMLVLFQRDFELRLDPSADNAPLDQRQRVHAAERAAGDRGGEDVGAPHEAAGAPDERMLLLLLTGRLPYKRLTLGARPPVDSGLVGFVVALLCGGARGGETPTAVAGVKARGSEWRQLIMPPGMLLSIKKQRQRLSGISRRAQVASY